MQDTIRQYTKNYSGLYHRGRSVLKHLMQKFATYVLPYGSLDVELVVMQVVSIALIYIILK